MQLAWFQWFTSISTVHPPSFTAQIAQIPVQQRTESLAVRAANAELG
jgi:hypothetical protein